jgi:hypothetical protein
LFNKLGLTRNIDAVVLNPLERIVLIEEEEKEEY